MQKGQVVIGANYGDEGKGLMTDYFASLDPENTLVVRFNGGAQAGHTVLSPTGQRHVFSHFGAASFLGCPTLLSKFFIVNPMLFAKELKELKLLGTNPEVILDPRALVSTPFDVFINQQIESLRGSKKHGSCGVGINETVTRCTRSANLQTTVLDLAQEEKLHSMLMNLNQTWLPIRLAELNIDINSDAVQHFIRNIDKIIERFQFDTKQMLSEVNVSINTPQKTQIIFEGAQGLMLDEFRKDQFPHVTRSRTGLTNVLELLPSFEIEELNVTYVSRTYLTRHGAGPLKGEDQFKFTDNTNIPNQFQGSLRFANLDTVDLCHSIEIDLKRATQIFPRIKAGYAFTCADQMDLPNKSKLQLPIRFASYGPSRHDVAQFEQRILIAAPQLSS